MYREKRKRIAVNLDQTLANTLENLVQWHNSTFDTHFKTTDFTTHDYWKVWGGNREESYLKIRDFYESEYFDQIQPIQDFALEALKMLKKRHFSLVVITSRQQFVAAKTKKFIDKHYPGLFESIYFCNLNLTNSEQLEYISKPKSLICQEIGVDVFIDNCLEHVFDVANSGVDVLLYDKQGQYVWNHQQVDVKSDYTLTATSKRVLYNQHVPDMLTQQNNMHRVMDWKEIIAQFPKPKSPLCNCYYPKKEEEEDSEEEEEEEEEEETEEETVEEEEEEERLEGLEELKKTNNYYGYETIEVELDDDDENYSLWRENNRIWA